MATSSPFPVVRAGFALCILSALLGTAVCLFQAPETRARQLALAGQAYYTQAYADGLQKQASVHMLDLSARTLVRALHLDPDNAQYWSWLTMALRARGAEAQADQALAMAQQLKRPAPENGPGAPAPLRLAAATE